MNCKECGAQVPEPPPKVVVETKLVDRSDAHYIVRAICVVSVIAIVGILAATFCALYESYVIQKAIGDPTIKVEMTEYDGQSRIVRKLNR